MKTFESAAIAQRATTRLLEEERSAYLHFEVQDKFLKQLQKKVPALKNYKLDRHELHRIYKNGEDYWDTKLRDIDLKALLADLKKIGYKVREEDKFDYYLDVKGEWPITVRDLDGLSLSVRGDRDHALDPYPGEEEIAKALKAKGIKFEQTKRSPSNPDLSFTVSRKIGDKNLTGKTLATIVAQALDAAIRTSSPRYINNPWSKAGKSKIFPNETTSYIITAGSIEYKIIINDKNSFLLYSRFTPESWRRKL